MRNAELKSIKSGKIGVNFVKKMSTVITSAVERDVLSSRVQALYDAINADDTIPFRFTTACIGNKVTAKTYRLNGQHSMKALERCTEEMIKKANLMYIHDHYIVKDKNALIDLFRKIDWSRSSRNSVDISGAYQGKQPSLNNVKKSFAQKATQGINHCSHLIDNVPLRHGVGVCELFNHKEYHPFIIFTGKILSIQKTGMRFYQTTGAMYAMHRVNVHKAKDFWQLIVSGGTDDKNHPTTKLAEYLTMFATIRHSERPTERDFYNACIQAWNKYCEDKSLKEINVGKVKGFIPILK